MRRDLAFGPGLTYRAPQPEKTDGRMLRYALTRSVSLGLSLAAASLVVFLVIEVVPGDPAAYMLGLNASPEAVAALRAELGLDAGPVERYFAWVSGMMRGDFGIS